MLPHLRLREVCTGRSGLWWSSGSLWCIGSKLLVLSPTRENRLATNSSSWSHMNGCRMTGWVQLRDIFFCLETCHIFFLGDMPKISSRILTVRFFVGLLKVLIVPFKLAKRSTCVTNQHNEHFCRLDATREGEPTKKTLRHQLLLVWCCHQCRLPPHLPHSLLHHRRMMELGSEGCRVPLLSRDKKLSIWYPLIDPGIKQ